MRRHRICVREANRSMGRARLYAIYTGVTEAGTAILFVEVEEAGEEDRVVKSNDLRRVAEQLGRKLGATYTGPMKAFLAEGARAP